MHCLKCGYANEETPAFDCKSCGCPLELPEGHHYCPYPECKIIIEVPLAATGIREYNCTIFRCGVVNGTQLGQHLPEAEVNALRAASLISVGCGRQCYWDGTKMVPCTGR